MAQSDGESLPPKMLQSPIARKLGRRSRFQMGICRNYLHGARRKVSVRLNHFFLIKQESDSTGGMQACIPEGLLMKIVCSFYYGNKQL